MSPYWESVARERMRRDFERYHFGHASADWDRRYARSQRVWELRNQGLTLRCIGEVMGFTGSRAAQLLNQHRRHLHLERCWWTKRMPFGDWPRKLLG